MKFMAVWSDRKGGTSKTTIATTLAHKLSINGFSTLIVDADPKGSVSGSFGYPKAPNTIKWLKGGDLTRSAMRDGLDAIRGNEFTDQAEKFFYQKAEMELEMSGEDRKPQDVAVDMIKERLSALLDLNYDCVVFDCPPQQNLLVRAIMAMCDVAVVPTSMSAEETESAESAVRFVQCVNPEAHIVIAPNRVNFNPAHDTLDTQGMASITAKFSGNPSVTIARPIPPCVAMVKASNTGRTIFEVPKSYSPSLVPELRELFSELADTVMSGT